MWKKDGLTASKQGWNVTASQSNDANISRCTNGHVKVTAESFIVAISTGKQVM